MRYILVLFAFGLTFGQQGYVGISGMSSVFDAVLKNKYGFDSSFIRGDSVFSDTNGLKTYKYVGTEDTLRPFPLKDKDRQAVGIYGICGNVYLTGQSNTDSLTWQSKFDCKNKNTWYPSGQYTTFDTTLVDSVFVVRKGKTCIEPAWPIICDSIRVRRSARTGTSKAKFYPSTSVRIK